MSPRYHLRPYVAFQQGKSQRCFIPLQHFRVEYPHYQFFAKRGRHGGEAQFNFQIATVTRFHAPILWSPFFRDIHSTEDFYPAGHCPHHRCRHFVYLVQHAIDAKSHMPLIAPRLDVNIAGALLEGILQ